MGCAKAGGEERREEIAPDRTNNLYEFLNRCLGEGQSLISGHGYDRLLEPVATRAPAKLHAFLQLLRTGLAVEREAVVNLEFGPAGDKR